MTPAPTGVVTLAFTDLEGSTVLWEKLGDGFQPFLARHHSILRRCLEARGGFEVKTEGDAFMIAFRSASEALRFALEAQEALAAEAWPAETGELRVRMGLHAGEPLCIVDSATGRPDYYGPAVNRAARIAAAAHGGQVLLSAATWELAGEARDAAEAADLGDHRLKGLERPERIWQVIPRSLASRRFPPLKTLSARPTNLPVPGTSFVGRERELRDLAAVLAEPATRLVTLTGPGGTGKTRLALRLGADLLDAFEGGVWFADLSEARDAAGAAGAAARALGVPVGERESPEERVAAALEFRKPFLLILDNFEQVVEAGAATVGMWRRKAPHVRFLVTSRALLGLAGEREFEVPPLGLPSASGSARMTARLEAYDGVRLFLERAREADPKFVPEQGSFAAIAELVARLDGIPLAIELAAARMKVLKPAEMLARLDKRFQVLRSSRRDLPPRQQTLLGAIDWTYDLLSAWERSAFGQLSVFHGGFFLEDAEAVLDLSAFPDAPDGVGAVQALREKSVLRSWSTPFGTRFGMFASLQEYGAQKLSEAERAVAEKRHAARVVEGCGQVWEHYENGPWPEDLDRLDLDRVNLRAAHRWALAAGDADLKRMFEEALAMPAPSAAPWRLEARIRLTSAIEKSGDYRPARAMAVEIERDAAAAGHKALAARAVLLRAGIDRDAVDIDERVRDLESAAAALLESGDLFSAVSARVAAASAVSGRDARAALPRFADAEALAARGPSPYVVLPVLLLRVRVLESLGRFEEVLADLDRAEPLLRALGERLALGGCLESRGRLLGFRGDTGAGGACLDEAEALFRELGARHFLASLLLTQAGRWLEAHQFDRTLGILEEAERLARDTGRESMLSSILNLRGLAQARRGDPEAAGRSWDAAREIGRRLQQPRSVAQTEAFVADLHVGRREWAKALAAIEESMRLYEELGVMRSVSTGRIVRGLALLELGRVEESVRDLETALAELSGMDIAATDIGIRTRIYLGRALAAKGDRGRAGELLSQTRREAEAQPIPEVREALAPLLDALERAVQA